MTGRRARNAWPRWLIAHLALSDVLRAARDNQGCRADEGRAAPLVGYIRDLAEQRRRLASRGSSIPSLAERVCSERRTRFAEVQLGGADWRLEAGGDYSQRARPESMRSPTIFNPSTLGFAAISGISL